MRIVLADLASADGFVSKDTVVGGYGSRLRPFSRVTAMVCAMKRRMHDLPSVQLGYIAAISANAGHEVLYTDGPPVDGDVAIVLTSLVDHRREAAWAAAQRARGVRVGFVGLTASKMPELFDAYGDFVIQGEPESAIMALAGGARLDGRVGSTPITDLTTLPFPRWDIIRGPATRRWSVPFAGRPTGGAFPVLASRGCPEFCTYCPHRILAGHRAARRRTSPTSSSTSRACARSPTWCFAIRCSPTTATAAWRSATKSRPAGSPSGSSAKPGSTGSTRGS